MITKEMFGEWKHHPVTEEVFEEINQVKEKLVEHLAEGFTVSDTADRTHGNTIAIVNQIKGLNQLLNIEYVDELEEEIDHENSFDLIEN